MFRQLSRVTGNYSLIIVNNGFDDHGLVKELEPLHYVENLENTGAIRGINQGLDLAEGKYAAVLHSDVLIYDEGWLDHIVEFMDRRPDVGLVGLAGRHSLGNDGNYINESTVYNNRTVSPLYCRPTWRFTEVAVIDGVGWVMRNDGTRLDERYGLMHCYDLDLSLQYLQGGHRVFAASVAVFHFADDFSLSSRSCMEYLKSVGGDDAAYYNEAKKRLAEKWCSLLPITRGFRDEGCSFELERLLKASVEELRSRAQSVRDAVVRLETANGNKQKALREGIEYVERLQKEVRLVESERNRLKDDISRMESGLRVPPGAAALEHRFPGRADPATDYNEQVK